MYASMYMYLCFACMFSIAFSKHPADFAPKQSRLMCLSEALRETRFCWVPARPVLRGLDFRAVPGFLFTGLSMGCFWLPSSSHFDFGISCFTCVIAWPLLL